jgi:hypothetical protein
MEGEDVQIPAVQGSSRPSTPVLRPPSVTQMAAEVVVPPPTDVAVAVTEADSSVPPPNAPDPVPDPVLSSVDLVERAPSRLDTTGEVGGDAAATVAVPSAERRPSRGVEKVLDAHKAKLTKIFKFYSNLHQPPRTQLPQPADSDLTVGLAAFVQFGQDFNIVPTLLSPQQMRYVGVNISCVCVCVCVCVRMLVCPSSL